MEPSDIQRLRMIMPLTVMARCGNPECGKWYMDVLPSESVPEDIRWHSGQGFECSKCKARVFLKPDLGDPNWRFDYSYILAMAKRIEDHPGEYPPYSR
jgi:hypothetical protein